MKVMVYVRSLESVGEDSNDFILVSYILHLLRSTAKISKSYISMAESQKRGAKLIGRLLFLDPWLRALHNWRHSCSLSFVRVLYCFPLEEEEEETGNLLIYASFGPNEFWPNTPKLVNYTNISIINTNLLYNLKYTYYFTGKSFRLMYMYRRC